MERLVYRDECGDYRIVRHKDGSATAFHSFFSFGWHRRKIGDYKSVAGAKRGLSRYCGGMPERINLTKQ